MATSENDLTAWFAELFGPVAPGEVWSGDDTAVVTTGDRTLITVDSMSEGVDFELDWARGEDVGYKLVAINVSDIAAMGGEPTSAVATIQLGDDTSIELVRSLAAGINEAARKWDVNVVGGDIGHGSELSLTLTLLGDPGARPVLRSGARPGDALCVTGSLGAAHAGLVLLQLGQVDLATVRAEIDERSGADGLAVLAARQLRPEPRSEAGRALRELATAMIDVSDGFAIDLERLCRASKVGCEVAASDLPVHPDLEHAARAVDGFPAPLDCAVLGGEDLELLFTVAPDDLDAMHAALDDAGTSVSVVGQITGGARTLDGRPLEERSDKAWDHLRIR